MRTYRTPKGTELPLLNLRGRDYLEVKFRLVWFREEHPDWRIETEILSHDKDSSLVCARIKDAAGNLMATAHKIEDRKGFADHLEKAETSAIGRALALVGYGTQFCADDLDEGERLVDSPMDCKETQKAEIRVEGTQQGRMVFQSKQPATDPGDYQVTFGKKYKGQRLKDIGKDELQGYMEWLEESASAKGIPLSDEARFLKVAIDRYAESIKRSANPPRPRRDQSEQTKAEFKGGA